MLPGGRLKTLMQEDYAYRIYKLSDDQQTCIFTRQNYRESRDLWWSKTDFARPVKITHINPQQKEYLWREVKLMDWTNYEGKQNQGLLYLPENYDLAWKYPLLVQFYETHSDNYHFLYNPAAQRAWTLRMQQFYDYYLKGTAMPRWMKEGINVNERGIDQKYEYVK